MASLWGCPGGPHSPRDSQPHTPPPLCFPAAKAVSALSMCAQCRGVYMVQRCTHTHTHTHPCSTPPSPCAVYIRCSWGAGGLLAGALGLFFSTFFLTTLTLTTFFLGTGAARTQSGLGGVGGLPALRAPRWVQVGGGSAGALPTTCSSQPWAPPTPTCTRTGVHTRTHTRLTGTPWDLPSPQTSAAVQPGAHTHTNSHTHVCVHTRPGSRMGHTEHPRNAVVVQHTHTHTHTRCTHTVHTHTHGALTPTYTPRAHSH